MAGNVTISAKLCHMVYHIVWNSQEENYGRKLHGNYMVSLEFLSKVKTELETIEAIVFNSL